MPFDKINAWEKAFRDSAELDAYKSFSDHLEFVGLEGDPKNMLEATIELVRTSAAYYCIDHQPVESFLENQTYYSTSAPQLTYIYTFDLCGKAYARTLDDSEHKLIDLADLFGSPWEEYKVAGYSQFWISRADRKPLLIKEIKQLIKLVRDDLYFDYGKDNLLLHATEAPDRSFIHIVTEEI